MEKTWQNKWESEEIIAITSGKPEFMRIKVKQIKVDYFSLMNVCLQYGNNRLLGCKYCNSYVSRDASNSFFKTEG